MENNKNLIIFGKNVKKFRIVKKLTQEQLAEIICVSSVQIGRIESGKNACTIQLLLKLCCALNCTPNELFENIQEVPLKNSDSLVLANTLSNSDLEDSETKKLLRHILTFFENK